MDPFTTPFLAGNEDFAREWAFLEQDREVDRQDAARGRRAAGAAGSGRAAAGGGPDPQAAAAPCSSTGPAVTPTPRVAATCCWASTAATGTGSSPPTRPGGFPCWGCASGCSGPSTRRRATPTCIPVFVARFHHSLIAAPRRGSRLADKQRRRAGVPLGRRAAGAARPAGEVAVRRAGGRFDPAGGGLGDVPPVESVRRGQPRRPPPAPGPLRRLDGVGRSKGQGPGDPVRRESLRPGVGKAEQPGRGCRGVAADVQEPVRVQPVRGRQRP